MGLNARRPGPELPYVQAAPRHFDRGGHEIVAESTIVPATLAEAAPAPEADYVRRRLTKAIHDYFARLAKPKEPKKPRQPKSATGETAIPA